MKKITLVCAVLLILSAFLAGCEIIQQTIAPPKATVTSGGGPDMASAQAESYSGPKARIAVSRFTDKTAKGWWTGEIGDGMAEMMATALFNTNRFIVLERQQIGDVLAEQDLGAGGRVQQETSAPIGQIEGAELLITGAVTGYEPGASGYFGGIGGGKKDIAGGVIAALKGSYIAIDVRVIDTKTSRILSAATVEGTASDIEGLIGMAIGKIGLGTGLGGWSKTPMEKALRLCIQESVNFIVSKTPAEYYHYSAKGEPIKVSQPPVPAPSQAPSPTTTPSPASAVPQSIIAKGSIGYVTVDLANIRSGPGMEYPVLTTAPKGEQLTIIEGSESWYKVKTGDGKEGWIRKDLFSLPPSPASNP